MSDPTPTSELRAEVNSDTPSIDDGSTSSSSLTPDLNLGVSKRTIALVGAVIVVAAIVWYLRSYSSSSDESSDEPAGDQEEPDRQQSDSVIRIPSNPTEELDKDEAVLEGLREGGVIGGDD